MPFPPSLHRPLNWDHVQLLRQVGKGGLKGIWEKKYLNHTNSIQLATAKVYEAKVKGKIFAVKKFDVDDFFNWSQNDRYRPKISLFLKQIIYSII